MEKKVKWMTQYAKLFAKAMKKIGRKDYKKLENLFRNRYMNYLCADEFEEYRRYGTLPLEKIYAAITYVQICLESGFSMEEAQKIWEDIMHKGERERAKFLCTCVDRMKSGYKKIANYLENDARKHKADESMTFEVLQRSDEKLELKVTRCAYMEIFEKYGIRDFCKVFCNSMQCMEVLQKNVQFVKYSDLLSGDCCHCVLIKK